jgi:hypothetical protein
MIFRVARQGRSEPSGSSPVLGAAVRLRGLLGCCNVILVDRHEVMVIELNAVFKAAKFGETAAELTRGTAGDEVYSRHAGGPGALFEQLLRRDRQSIGDLGRAIEGLQNVSAERTMKLARGADEKPSHANHYSPPRQSGMNGDDMRHAAGRAESCCSAARGCDRA